MFYAILILISHHLFLATLKSKLSTCVRPFFMNFMRDDIRFSMFAFLMLHIYNDYICTQRKFGMQSLSPYFHHISFSCKKCCKLSFKIKLSVSSWTKLITCYSTNPTVSNFISHQKHHKTYNK